MDEWSGIRAGLDDPPIAPPEGCIDPYLWQLARQLLSDHSRTPSGECVTCPGWKPCPGLALARDGLATALGQSVRNSAYWIAYAQLHRPPVSHAR
ncbi:hypothetical protein Cs7R123_13440 [Catellatospora sp. TT07R-123]|uniref:hypothetical protein n=1 Tax=Catellatospora sp. TT07R-123 TaxID=2733863 RepID=UPI001B2A3826|nr:hypothetical protein [Catellatospora sp. TT07R-123]GHJ44002.1 hypothetical protein Cs7R123_13440 [Catellatospora sp. TT07R-123]